MVSAISGSGDPAMRLYYYGHAPSGPQTAAREYPSARAADPGSPVPPVSPVRRVLPTGTEASSTPILHHGVQLDSTAMRMRLFPSRGEPGAAEHGEAQQPSAGAKAEDRDGTVLDRMEEAQTQRREWMEQQAELREQAARELEAFREAQEQAAEARAQRVEELKAALSREDTEAEEAAPLRTDLQLLSQQQQMVDDLLNAQLAARAQGKDTPVFDQVLRSMAQNGRDQIPPAAANKEDAGRAAARQVYQQRMREAVLPFLPMADNFARIL